ncbi:hypothetical protein [Paractinoplanes hotanensis]|nr:hypothetical protein [Actinoplanes hotanensis]
MTERDLYGTLRVLLQQIALVSKRDRWAMRTLVTGAERRLG